MVEVHPPQDTPRQATAVTHPLRQPPPQPPRRPWWWSRPLIVGLALVVVAALVPRALADDSSPVAASGTGEPPTLDVTAQAEAMTETFEPDLGEAEVSVSPERTSVDGEPGADTAGLAQGTGSEDRPTGDGEQEQPPSQERILVAERDLARQEQGDQHDATVTGGAGDPGKPPTGGQDQGNPAGPGQQADANQGCDTGGSCSTEPLSSGAAAAAAGGGAGGWWSRHPTLTRWVGKLGLQPQPPQETAPRDRGEQLKQERQELARRIDVEIRDVEDRQARLDAEGGTRTWSQHEADDAITNWAVYRLGRLASPQEVYRYIDARDGKITVSPWEAERHEEIREYLELNSRVLALRNALRTESRRLEEARRQDAEGPPESQRMSMVDPKEAVAGTPGFAGTQGTGDLPGTAPLDQQARRAADAVPGTAPLDQQARRVTDDVPGTAPLDERARRQLANESFAGGAAPARPVSQATKNVVGAAVASVLGYGLRFVTPLLEAAMCKGRCPPAVLGPLAPGATGAVPSHLQG
jgi:hypothetical protein